MGDVAVEQRKSWVRSGQVTSGFFISDIWTPYIRIFSFLPLLFWLLRTHSFPPTMVSLTDSLFNKLTFAWPALENQQVSIWASLGEDQALWFAAFFLTLFLSLLVPLGRMVLEIYRRGQDVVPAQLAEKAMIPIVVILDVYVLIADKPRRTLIYDFLPDQWGIFYLRQSVAFSIVAFTLMIIALFAWRLGAKVRRALFGNQ